MPGGFFDWSKCFLGFARFTLSLQYIYTRWSLSACSFSLNTLSPSPDLNKTSLASLSPHCCSKSQQDPSAGKGRRLNAVAVGEGGNPLSALLFTFHPAAARVSAFWERGSPDLPACGPRRGSASGPVRPIFANKHSRPSLGAKPREAGDSRPPRERPHQVGSRGAQRSRQGKPREVLVT